MVKIISDSVYTERYMGSPKPHPESNFKGYEAADVTKLAGNLKDKKFLLLHGTSDDNVHFHHSMMLSHSLIEEGVLFKQMVSNLQLIVSIYLLFVLTINANKNLNTPMKNLAGIF